MVEWHKNNVPVPNNNGIESQSVTTSATVSASLSWTRGFVGSDNGSYQCVVYKQNTNIPVTTQPVQLNARQSTTTLPTTPQPCSVQQTSIHFQIRVFATDCERWEEATRTEIANNFRTELLSVVRTECSCVFEESSVKISGAAQCSTKVSGAAVFRGQIETDSQPETEQIFCSLRSWQQKPPLILIDGQLRAVDGNCSLEASGSSSSGEECVAPTDSTPVLGLIEIVAIAGGGVCFILLLLICCLCCCYRRRKKVKVTKDDHIYTR